MDALGHPPNALFAAPEAPVAEDGHLVALRDLLKLVAQDVVSKVVNVSHFLAAPLQGLFGRYHTATAAT